MPPTPDHPAGTPASAAVPAADRKRATVEIRIADANQLFNSLDPTPFPEKDLDADAEEFIVSWATELPRKAPLRLRVHLSKPADEADVRRRIAEGVHRFFTYRAHMSRLRMRRLLSTGRNALLIGLGFLGVCVTLANVLPRFEGPWHPAEVIRESLVIAGWVAMWKPMEVFLYDWWPLRHERRVYDRLGTCEVEVVEAGAAHAG